MGNIRARVPLLLDFSFLIVYIQLEAHVVDTRDDFYAAKSMSLLALALDAAVVAATMLRPLAVS